jgi:hypothetical protein
VIRGETAGGEQFLVYFKKNYGNLYKNFKFNVGSFQEARQLIFNLMLFRIFGRLMNKKSLFWFIYMLMEQHLKIFQIMFSKQTP